MKELDESTVGGRIRKLRIEAGITQEELAKYLKTARPNISKYEHDKCLFSVEKLIQMAVIFNCSVDYILTGSVTADVPAESLIIQQFRQVTIPRYRWMFFKNMEAVALHNSNWSDD